MDSGVRKVWISVCSRLCYCLKSIQFSPRKGKTSNPVDKKISFTRANEIWAQGIFHFLVET